MCFSRTDSRSGRPSLKADKGGVSGDLSWGVVGGAGVGTGAEVRLKPGMVRKVSGAWVLPPAIAHNDGSSK